MQASSAEIFGQPARSPQDEDTPVRPVNPYGAAKAFAHLACGVLRGRGLHAAAVILYNHESPLRPRHFVTRKITATVAAIARGEADRLELGNLDARRDWGWAPDYVDAMVRAARADRPGDYVVATGVAHSVRDFVAAAFTHAGITDWEPLVHVDQSLVRPVDATELVGDATRAAKELGWTPTVGFEEVVARMVDADLRSSRREPGRLHPGVERFGAYLGQRSIVGPWTATTRSCSGDVHGHRYDGTRRDARVRCSPGPDSAPVDRVPGRRRGHRVLHRSGSRPASDGRAARHRGGRDRPLVRRSPHLPRLGPADRACAAGTTATCSAPESMSTSGWPAPQLLAAALVGIGCYLAKYQLSRGFFVLAFAVGVPAAPAGALRCCARRSSALDSRATSVGTSSSWDRRLHRRDRTCAAARDLAGLRSHRRPDARRPTPTARPPPASPCVGNTDDVARDGPRLGADLVFFAGGGIASASQMRHTMWELEDADIHVVVAPSMTDVASERVKIRPVGGLPLIHIGKPRAADALSWAKRGLRRPRRPGPAAALRSPLMAVAALAIAAPRPRSDPVPAGADRARRRAFACLKFRTMIVDAEARLQSAARAGGPHRRPVQDDGGPAGHPAGPLAAPLLHRRAPQLWNVLRGRDEPGRTTPAAAERGRDVRPSRRRAGCGSGPA